MILIKMIYESDLSTLIIIINLDFDILTYTFIPRNSSKKYFYKNFIENSFFPIFFPIFYNNLKSFTQVIFSPLQFLQKI